MSNKCHRGNAPNYRARLWMLQTAPGGSTISKTHLNEDEFCICNLFGGWMSGL